MLSSEAGPLAAVEAGAVAAAAAAPVGREAEVAAEEEMEVVSSAVHSRRSRCRTDTAAPRPKLCH